MSKTPGVRHECHKVKWLIKALLRVRRKSQVLCRVASVSLLLVCNPRIASRVFALGDLHKPYGTHYVGNAGSMVSEQCICDQGAMDLQCSDK